MSPKTNARTQFFLDNPKFIYAVGRKYGIPENELADYQQYVLLRSLLSPPAKHTKDMKGEALHFCRNRAVIYKKNLKRNDHQRLIQPEDKAPSPERQAEKKEETLDLARLPDSFNLTAREQKKIRILSGKLSARQKECFLLLLSGKKQREAAVVMGISKARVSQIVKQIRRKYVKIQ